MNNQLFLLALLLAIPFKCINGAAAASEPLIRSSISLLDIEESSAGLIGHFNTTKSLPTRTLKNQVASSLTSEGEFTGLRPSITTLLDVEDIESIRPYLQAFSYLGTDFQIYCRWHSEEHGNMKVTYGNHYYVPLCILAGRAKFPELLEYLKDLIEDLVTSGTLTPDEAASSRVVYCLSYCYLAASLCVSKRYFNELRTFNTGAPAARYNGRVPAIRYLAGEKSIDAAQNTHLFARSRVIALINEFKKTGKFHTSYSSVIGHYHKDKTRYRHSVNGEDSCCTVM